MTAVFTPESTVQRAVRDRGMGENPAHSNCTPITHRYEQLVGPISPNGCFAWCCASVIEWWYDASGGKLLVPTAAVGQLLLYGKQGKYGLRYSPVPVVGGADCYGWLGPGTTDWNKMHTGICISERGVADHDNCEGNYADRVDLWNRDGKYFLGCVVPTFDADTPPVTKPSPHLEGLLSLNAITANLKTGEELDFRLVDGHVRYKNSDANSPWVSIPDGPAAGLDWSKVGKPITGLTAADRPDGVTVVSVMTDAGLTMRIGKPFGHGGNAPGGVWDTWVSLGQP